MGLSMHRTLDNGVQLNYWRVVRVDCVTNGPRIIEVAGYTSKAKRATEKTALAAGEPFDVYVHTQFHEADPSNEGMSCEEAYAYLKTLDEFSEAEDVIEEEEDA